jgi:hypothetical protein
MTNQQKKRNANHLIWKRVMHILTEKQNNKAGSNLHQKSLIDINMFIEKTEKELRIIH